MDTSIPDVKALLEILASHSSNWNGAWTFFSTVSVAIVAVVASGKILPRHRWAASIMAAVGFLVFATGNFIALDHLREQREAVSEFVILKAKEKKYDQVLAVAKASEPPTAGNLKLYHWSLCAFVVVLLLLIPRFLTDPADESKPAQSVAAQRDQDADA